MTSKEIVQKVVKRLQEDMKYYSQFDTCEDYYETYGKLGECGQV